MGKKKNWLSDLVSDNTQTDSLNPFDAGVTYEAFLNSIPKGKTVAEQLKDKCTPEQIAWVELEIKHLNK